MAHLNDTDLQLYHAQGMSPEEAANVREHLDGCAVCSRRHADLLEATQAADDAGPAAAPLPPGQTPESM